MGINCYWLNSGYGSCFGPSIGSDAKRLERSKNEKRRSLTCNCQSENETRCSQPAARLQGGLEEANLEITKRQSEDRATDCLKLSRKPTPLSQGCQRSQSTRGPCFGAVRSLAAAIRRPVENEETIARFFHLLYCLAQSTSSLGLVSALRVSTVAVPLLGCFASLGQKVRRSWHSDR